MKKVFLFFITISIILVVSQCTYHNVEEYYANTLDTITNCGDTIDVSFSKDVFPLVADHCISCHNDITQYAGRNYDSYEGILEVVENGKLLKVINHEPGYVQMPKNADKLAQCYIDIIEAWIRQGSKDN